MRAGDNGDENESFLNHFVRFKQHIDSAFASAFNTMARSEQSQPPHGDRESTDFTAMHAMLPLRSLLWSSSYSPTSLRHLPQPVPNDLPEHLDGTLFSFEDAFEDLLAVSQGQPLPDIQQRYEQKKLIRSMFPSGEPSFFWRRRLQASGLLGPQPRTPVNHSDWDDLHKQLERKASEVWGRSTDMIKDIKDDDSVKEVVQQVDALSKNVEKLFKNFESSWMKGSGDRSEPNHFDDLFSTLQVVHDSGKKSWDTFMKSFADAQAAREKQTKPETPPPASTSETKIVESRDEHVDKYGYHHSTVTRRELDDEGNEVGRTTTHQMYYPGERNWEEPKGRAEALDTGALDDEEEKRRRDRTGWFWK